MATLLPLRTVSLGFLLQTAALLIHPSGGVVEAQVMQTTMVSENAARSDSASGVSENPVVSGDGEVIVFSSTATDLVSGDANAKRDVFLYRRETGATSMVSTDASGGQGDGDSGTADTATGGQSIDVSGTGRYVVFTSNASSFQIADQDSNGGSDIYLKDMSTGDLKLVSVNPYYLPSNGESAHPSIPHNPDDEDFFVAFDSSATTLLISDLNGTVRDVVLRSMTSVSGVDVFELVSQSSEGTQADADSTHPSISSDSSKVAFLSVAQNLVEGTQGSVAQIYLRDRSEATTIRVSENASGEPANAACLPPQLSSDGRTVVFASRATNLDSRCSDGARHIFRADLSALPTVSIECITLAPSGSAANGDSGAFAQYAVNGSGSAIAFTSLATNLLSSAMGSGYTYLYTQSSGAVTLMSTNASDTEAYGVSGFVSMSDEGDIVAFDSASDRLVTPDSNIAQDVFFVTPGVARPPILNPDTTIEDAPVVVVEGASVDVVMAEFSGAREKKKRKRRLVTAAGSKERLTITYRVFLTRTDIAATRRRLTSKRNSLTVRGLAPGSYEASYRIVAKRGTKKVFATNMSPAEAFTITGS